MICRNRSLRLSGTLIVPSGSHRAVEAGPHEFPPEISIGGRDAHRICVLTCISGRIARINLPLPLNFVTTPDIVLSDISSGLTPPAQLYAVNVAIADSELIDASCSKDG